MVDIGRQPKSPETTLAEKELERFEAENEGLEVIEQKPEKDAATGNEAETLRWKIKKDLPNIAEDIKEDLVIQKDVEERIETIVNNFVKSARVANFDDEKVQQIIGKSKMYIAKGYPNIADEVHDRILAERDRWVEESHDRGMH